MSNGPDRTFPPWLSESIGKAVRWAVARKWVADADREDIVHDVWVELLRAGETPTTVAATPRAVLWERLLTLANRAAARASRARMRRPQADALTGIHDASADPARSAEQRDVIEWIAQALRDLPLEQRRLVAQALGRKADSEIARTFADQSGLTEHDLFTGTKAMTPKNRQTLHRLVARLRTLVACLTLLAATEASHAQTGDQINTNPSAPAPVADAGERDHWN